MIKLEEMEKARDEAKKLSDVKLLAYLDEHDPNAEHDDLMDPDSLMSEYWREAGNRGLLNQ